MSIRRGLGGGLVRGLGLMRITAFLLVMLLAPVMLFGCGSSDSEETGSTTESQNADVSQKNDEAPESVEITEKMFVAQINDIYTNPDLYLGATITLEGMLETYVDEITGEKWYFVYRYGPGCCGNDSLPGFEIELGEPVPGNGSWVRASGTLGSIDYDGQSYLILKSGSVEVLEVRGQETVQ